MKKLIIIISLLTTIISNAQNTLHAGELDWVNDTDIPSVLNYQAKSTTAGCGTPFLSTGYPLWTNYWAGWMVNIINTNTCPITINSFEARFGGTSGYRIYTKTGTFVGFETTAGAWTLVGTLASLTGTSTTAPTAIPIPVGITIPAGATQAFYLTRSDNVVANRHLYVPGAGTAGTTVYAADGNLSVTEGSYVDPFFAALQVGVRRPSFDVCYSIACPLPIEIVKFDVYKRDSYNLIDWVSATETRNDFYTIERSTDGLNWESLYEIDGAGTSNTPLFYEYKDYTPSKSINYYRLKQTDFDGSHEYFNIIDIDNRVNGESKTLIKITNIVGQEVESTSDGVFIYYYSDGTHQKVCKLSNF